ncbi:MAG: MerR family transcriptional regulator [Anaerorhabdus sp.]
MFKVSELAQLIGVEKSFLHYYDEIGLIVPEKNEKNYRLYNDNDLIAVASSKYYRSMGMSLKSLNRIIQTSDFDDKQIEMVKRQGEIKEEISRLQDILKMTEYAMATYHRAYHHEIKLLDAPVDCSFIPLVYHEEIIKENLDSPETKELLNFFPFVSYGYYFPEKALLSEKEFDYYLGIAVVKEFGQKYKMAVPNGTVECASLITISFSISKNISEESFTYEDFEEVRQFAQAHNLTLTGGGVAYCVFTNYQREKGNTNFFMQFFTK